MKKVFTLAGSDTSGGAGIQADLKTFEDNGVYGLTAITSIVTMNPEGWNHHVTPINIDVVERQLETILSLEIDAFKTGLLGSVDIIELAAKKINTYNLDQFVLDPVMVCKGENEVLQPENTEAMRELLLPLATITTPNLFEAEQLAKRGPIKTIDDLKDAAAKIHDLGAKNVVIKGGRSLHSEKAIDLFYDGREFTILEKEVSDTSYTHGAGCTFAAAITANLAKGLDVSEAVSVAKDFVTAAIAHGWRLNEYVGPVMHGAFNQFEK